MGPVNPIADKVRSYAHASWNRRSGLRPRWGWLDRGESGSFVIALHAERSPLKRGRSQGWQRCGGGVERGRRCRRPVREVREQARSYEEQKQKRVCSWTSRETSARTGTPLQKAERNRRSGGHATWMSREPRGLQGRTLGAGLRGGGVREGSPAPSGPYAGQAFLVPFCGGGLPPFDKRDSPEGAKQKISEHSVRRVTPSKKAAGLFPFGPAQALFAMEPRPAFAGMTG
ncbi:hypothetical protein SAMN05216577_11582 [Pseudomonas citronellolis]|uniref:Uncharacterized protein n=1 Tax=Pseudomonas citronellolis TaxID=53408 RepID=A0AAQ1KG44_9PSED|nr:hypothetical protein SAMN05216577_11582 [Pseudomonas citronellolis]